MMSVIDAASIDDVALLAGINRRAYKPEVISSFAETNWPDDTNMIEFFKARIVPRLEDTASKVFVAKDPSTRNILGFICCTLEDVQKEPSSTMQIMPSLPPFMNAKFVSSSAADVERLKGLMRGEKHYYLSAFAVEPHEQNKGVGTQLLKHCLKIADDANLPTWLIAFPGSHSLYKRHGFIDVDHCDIDLNAWDGNKFRGYGIYRQYAMVRQTS
ncbi:acyl-CoA N-acyltransferase [Astrocystis sublimbata]|nr:acyl-CoA N-acyltransferase [Astrocystis sublimbata]